MLANAVVLDLNCTLKSPGELLNILMYPQTNKSDSLGSGAQASVSFYTNRQRWILSLLPRKGHKGQATWKAKFKRKERRNLATHTILWFIWPIFWCVFYIVCWKSGVLNTWSGNRPHSQCHSFFNSSNNGSAQQFAYDTQQRPQGYAAAGNLIPAQ